MDTMTDARMVPLKEYAHLSRRLMALEDAVWSLLDPDVTGWDVRGAYTELFTNTDDVLALLRALGVTDHRHLSALVFASAHEHRLDGGA